MNRNFIIWRWGLVLILAVLSLGLAQRLKIGDDAKDLLPDKAVRGNLEMFQRIGLVDRIFITLEMVPQEKVFSEQEITSALSASAARIGSELAESPLFGEVVYRLPEGYEWRLFETIWQSLPALSSKEDLTSIATHLTPEGLRETLTADFALLNSLAGLPLKEQIRRDPLGLSMLFLKRLETLRGEFALQMRNGFFFSRDNANCLLWAQSNLSLTDSTSAEKINAEIERIIHDRPDPMIKVRVIGTLPHTLANARTIQKDLRRLLPLATVALIILLLVTIREPQAFLVLGVPYLAVPMTIAIHGLTYGHISRMALGFGVVLLGIAIDYTVHLYLSFSREPGSIAKIRQQLRLPISLGLATTLGVFIVLFFSDVPSHQQMAFFAIIGVSIAVALSYFLVPTMITERQLRNKPRHGESRPKGSLLWFGHHKFSVLTLWCLLLVAGSLSWSQLHYNCDLRTLDAPSTAVTTDEAYFRATWHHKEEQAFALVSGRDLAEALDRNDLVYEKLHAQGITQLQSIAPLLPGPASQTRNIAAWDDFWSKRRDKFSLDINQIGGETGFSAGAFTPFFDWLDLKPISLAAETTINGPLRPILISMLHIPDPLSIINKQNEDRQVLITTLMPDTTLSRSALEKMVTEGKVTIFSYSKWREQVEGFLRHDIRKLSILAILTNAGIVLFFFRKLRVVLASFAPVLSALSAMGICSLFTSGDLNVMHVLIGTMIIGISVDYGIFVVCAYQGGFSRTISLAVSICAVSTLICFGVLALAVHPALFTLGSTVLAGIGAAWPTALWVTPLLLKPMPENVL